MRGSGQHPVLKANSLEDNFPIALASRAGPKGDEWWREFERVALELYRRGPDEQDLWSRAGGDVSTLRPGLNGRAAWHSATRTVRLGGSIDIGRLVETMRTDFPQNAALRNLRATLAQGSAARQDRSGTEVSLRQALASELTDDDLAASNGESPPRCPT
jgi:hypothetical protein